MKKLTHWITAAVLTGSVLALAARAAESPSVLLQKGIYAEETEGNVDAAIKIYEQIGAEAATNRAVAAQAQYRLAVCYQKRGTKSQAIKVLNDLVQQFPSDAALTEKARAMLAELGVKPAEAVSVRNLQLPVPISWIMSASQDGRFVAYVPSAESDPTKRNEVAVCEMATGKTWTVAKNTKGYALENNAQISPDGQWIAWQLTGETDEPFFVAKIDGSEPRKIFSFDRKERTGALERWSPDSRHLIVYDWIPSNRAAGSLTFALDTKTGAIKELERRLPATGEAVASYTLLNELGLVWGNHCSADGRYVAQGDGQYPRKIVIRDLKSGVVETVVDADAGHCFGWFAADTKILYSKRRAGVTDLWASRMKDGKPVGEPELVWSNLGNVWPLAMSADGTVHGASPGGGLWVMQGLTTKNSMVASGLRTTTEIPPDEIFSPNRSILDRKLGLSGIYPAGWKVMRALRHGDGETLLAFLPADGDVSWPQIRYRATVPWENPHSDSLFKGANPRPTTPSKIDSWLLKSAQDFAEEKAKGQGFAGYRIRPESITRRTINGHPALSWSGDFERFTAGRWSDCVTIIYSEKTIVSVSYIGRVAGVEAFRPTFEELIETIRLP